MKNLTLFLLKTATTLAIFGILVFIARVINDIVL